MSRALFAQIRVTPDQWKIVDPMHREMITAEASRQLT